ncbi:hypothetical protein ACAZ28_10105 [Akkermansia muciniphila]|uniref:hypothetical protein n=1 Tax=Akkermansia sp. TaxID=1872421 RepID=UPI0011AEF500
MMKRIRGFCTPGQFLNCLQIVFIRKFSDVVSHLCKLHPGKPGKIIEDKGNILKNKLTAFGIRLCRGLPLLLLDALTFLLLNNFYFFPIIRTLLIIGKSRKGKQAQQEIR